MGMYQLVDKTNDKLRSLQKKKSLSHSQMEKETQVVVKKNQ